MVWRVVLYSKDSGWVDWREQYSTPHTYTVSFTNKKIIESSFQSFQFAVRPCHWSPIPLFHENIVKVSKSQYSGCFLQRQKWTIIYYVKKFSKYLSDENHILYVSRKLAFCLKTTKTPGFVFISEILRQTFWRNKWPNIWRSVFDVVKNLR